MAEKKGRMRDIDGGWAWWVAAWYGIWLFISGGIIKCTGLVFLEIMSRLELSVFQASWIFFTGSFLVCISGLIAGFLSDKMSMRPVMLMAAIVGAIGMIIFAFSTSLWMAIIGYSIINSGCRGIVHSCSAGGINKYFVRKRPLANTLSSCGNSAGGLVMPLLLVFSLQHAGFTQSLVMFACLWIHTCLGSVILKSAPTQRLTTYVKSQTTEAKDLENISPVDTNENSKDNELTLSTKEAEMDTEAQQASVELKENSLPGLNDKQSTNCIKHFSFLKDLQILLLYIALAICALAYFNWFLFLPSFHLQIGLTRTQTSICLALASASEGVVRPIIGAFLTRRNCASDKPLAVSVCCLVAGLSTLAASFVTSFWLVVAYALLFGATGCLFLPLVLPMIADHIQIGQVGSAAGLLPTFISTGNGVGSPLLGMVEAKTGSFVYVMHVIAGAYLLASILYFYSFSRTRKIRNKRH